MMKDITLVFPSQLFAKHPALDKRRTVVLAEDFFYFRQRPLHKQKLVLLRASMKNYQKYLKQKGYKTLYIESKEIPRRSDLFSKLHKMHVQHLYMAAVDDEELKQEVKKAQKKYGLSSHVFPSAMFLCDEEEIRALFQNKSRFSMAGFYPYMRKKLRLLLKDDGSPEGGKYSFDAENRLRLPKGLVPPKIYTPKKNAAVREAFAYVDKEFSNAIGSFSSFCYPTNFLEAQKALTDFLRHRIFHFGDYEDAIAKDHATVFHSVLSPLLNIGLLTPQDVIAKVMKHHAKTPLPIASLEGFLRQVIGWREFVRACYLLIGKEMSAANFFHHRRPLLKNFWNATTGITPLDATIKRVMQTGYCHHIERLMILGNFLLLTQTDPKEVYEWFMSCFVDAYDWVMIANVYGMSQYADGNRITTKPYICASNYLCKMGDYEKGEWTTIWDGLFWRFVSQHSDLFEKNPRTRVFSTLLKTKKKEIAEKIQTANQWLKRQH